MQSSTNREVEHTDAHLKIFFRISLVTLRVAVVAAVLAAEPRIEPADELLVVLRAEVVFLEDVLRDDPPVMVLPTSLPT